MWQQVGRLLVCLLGTCVSVSLGLNVNFDRTPDSRFCAQLQCVEDVSPTDDHIAYLIGLSAYNVTLYDTKVKLASVSIFDPALYLDPSKVEVVNGTGSLTKSQGRLALSFQDVADCLHGTFLCELDFFNLTGQPDSVSESTSSGGNGYCGLLEDQLRVLAARVDNLTSDSQTLKLENLHLQSALENVTQTLKHENLDLQSALENVTQTLKHENLDLQSALENVTQTLKHENLDLQSALESVTQRLAKLETQVNSSISKPQVLGTTCYPGMPSNTSRQEFLLWGRVPALCDTETDGGGWVVIQRRTKGDVDFYRGWADYKNGFGTPDTDFWIGLDVIHNLTSQDYSELRLEYVAGGTLYYGQYSSVSVASESGKYRISGGGFQGSAVDCLTGGNTNGAHNNMYFTTIDRDNDNGSGGNCAEWNEGGWWYNYCFLCNFNGLWGVNSTKGMAVDFNGSYQYLSFTEMKLRRG
ncbi:hypothetical protein BsWGS_06989 [Bradybaena similaris]